MGAIFFIFLLLLSSCGTALKARTLGGESDEETLSSPFYVTQILPQPGPVAALPSSVTIYLSEVPHRGTLSALTHYNLNCGDVTLAAAAVDSLSGFSSVTVTLPVISGLQAGDQCVFSASSKILDLAGNPLGGNRVVTYTIAP